MRSLEWYIKDVDADKAWSQVKQVRQIKVAVVDTGVDYTHTALKGKIAANSLTSGTDLVGTTGNLDVKIIPVKVLDSSGTGYSDIIAEGIQWAADKGADIINLSFGILILFNLLNLIQASIAVTHIETAMLIVFLCNCPFSYCSVRLNISIFK